MFDTKIKISIFLKFVEYVSVGFFVKVIATIENLKAQTFVFQEGIRSLKTITLVEIPTRHTLLRIVIGFIQRSTSKTIERDGP